MSKKDPPETVFAPPRVATLLPPTARTLLAAAATVDPSALRGESAERTKALDRVISRIRHDYPEFFT